MRIALCGLGFMGWGGGIDFLKNCARGLESFPTRDELFLFLPDDNTFVNTIKKYLRPFKKIAVDIITLRKPTFSPTPNNPQSLNELARIFSAKGKSALSVVIYKNNSYTLRKILRENNVDVILPSMRAFSEEEINVPWVGYIPDLQHKHLPEFFSEKEIKWRNSHFKEMTNRAKAVIVNSIDTKKDINRFFQGKAKIFNLPFAPILDEQWLNDDDRAQTRYAIKGNYFLISNQLWKHKSHITAFEALRKLHDEGCRDYKIVCTGTTHDYRFSRYFDELGTAINTLGLNDSVRFLGYIPKQDQVQLMKNATAVLQPTLFEGGPGGGAVYDAISLGAPVIVSDISVNLEIVGRNIEFFKNKSSDDMAAKMADVIKKIESGTITCPTKEELISNSKKNARILGEALFNVANFVAEKNGRECLERNFV